MGGLLYRLGDSGYAVGELRRCMVVVFMGECGVSCGGRGVWTLGANALGKISHHRSLGAALLLFPHTLASYANIAFGCANSHSAPLLPRVFILAALWRLNNLRRCWMCVLELPAYPRPLHYHALPMLDMVAPAPQLNQAADALQHQLEQHDLPPVLVCCALGYGRSNRDTDMVGTLWRCE